MLIGLISDTHGLLRGEVFDAFAGVEHILHAGDVGDPDILDELASIAPVTAVSGNTDGWEIASRVPEVARIELGGVHFTVVHGHRLGMPNSARVAAAYPDSGVVVFGHSHQPEDEKVGGVLAVNPGSAGPQRFTLPVTVALLTITPSGPTTRLVHLLRP